MNNLLIAEQFHLLAKMMELHQENVFKIKAIANAASIIEKLHQDITLQNYHQLAAIKGIGKNILEKIKEILSNGKIKELEEYEKITPTSVIEMLNIRGLGPSKVYRLWKELNIENIDDLIVACKEDKLANIKGFGTKTQQNIFENAEFYIQNKNKYQLGLALSIAEQIQDILQQHHIKAEITGELRRQCEVVSKLEWITTQTINDELQEQIQSLSEIPIIIHQVNKERYFYTLFQTTGSEKYLHQIHFHSLKKKDYTSEDEIFEELNIPPIPAFQRESNEEHYEVEKLLFNNSQLIKFEDIKGILHCHTNYSDGLNTVSELADYVRTQGFEYLAICDHSQSAKYANGLTDERLFQQIEEINHYNEKYTNFRILKGIESDILKDGSLDYSPDILKHLDIVVASIHSHFEMSKEEATKRIIKAIENPHTHILGHLTGRLLLIRKGYLIDHKKVIDACAANNVIIELNANTYRLDIDWRWLQYCLNRGVKIAINPDAHEKTAIYDTQYGVMVAQKAGLTKEMCLNAYDIKSVLNFLKK